jgi:gliding motility-associated protein GldM
MALPREPRQKMINMMYLVLTAMLALNVSSEILNAFKTVNKSLEESNKVVSISTGDIMASLQAKLSDAGTAEKAKIWHPHAVKVQELTTTLNNYIQGIKDKILLEAGADYAKKDSTYKDDNLDIATRLLVDKGEGKVLYNKLKQYQVDLLAIDPTIAKQFATSLPINLEKPQTQNKGNNTWEAAYFRMVPTVAALTILSKFQNDVKTSENKVVTFCHEQVGKVEFRFNQYEPIIGQNSQVLLAGQELEITAGLAAFNSDQKPTVTIGGAVVPLDEKGMAIKKFPVNSSGRIPVKVSYKNQEGIQQEKIVEVEYTVGQSSAAVQLDKMNVLFIGVDNPVTISGSGSVDQIQASISGGGGVFTGTGAHRTVRVSEVTDNCVINIKTPDGKTTSVNFRVRSIPDPTPMIGTTQSGDIQASVFKSQAGVRAYVKDFFYETQFNVTSFRMTGDGAGFEDAIEEANNTGAAWSEARKIVNKCRPGSFVTIEDIYAVGPDGRRRKLPAMIFYLK